MYNLELLEQVTKNADPDSLALVCTRDDLGGAEWASVRQHMEGVVLMAVSEGFYVWFALYYAAANNQGTAHREREIRHALSDHIYDLVGGPFFNHSSGRDGAPPYVREQQVDTLIDYRDKDLGML